MSAAAPHAGPAAAAETPATHGERGLIQRLLEPPSGAGFAGNAMYAARLLTSPAWVPPMWAAQNVVAPFASNVNRRLIQPTLNAALDAPVTAVEMGVSGIRKTAHFGADMAMAGAQKGWEATKWTGEKGYGALRATVRGGVKVATAPVWVPYQVGKFGLKVATYPIRAPVGAAYRGVKSWRHERHRQHDVHEKNKDTIKKLREEGRLKIEEMHLAMEFGVAKAKMDKKINAAKEHSGHAIHAANDNRPFFQKWDERLGTAKFAKAAGGGHGGHH